MPNGVRTDLFRHSTPEPFWKKYGLEPDEPFVLCVSRVDYQKNQLLLVRAFARFAAANPRWKLVLVGPVTVEQYGFQIMDEVRKAGLESRVLLIPGFQPDDPLLPSVYKAASMFVLPTVHEPFGIVILEAWAAGTPVIATRIGGIPGFTHDGQDILLFEKNDEAALVSHMETVANDGARRTTLIAGATREVSHYDWTAIALRMRGIYEQALERHARRMAG
jgi:glycosyltransferase involved in cell wall biosynthesis